MSNIDFTFIHNFSKNGEYALGVAHYVQKPKEGQENDSSTSGCADISMPMFKNVFLININHKTVIKTFVIPQHQIMIAKSYFNTNLLLVGLRSKPNLSPAVQLQQLSSSSTNSSRSTPSFDTIGLFDCIRMKFQGEISLQHSTSVKEGSLQMHALDFSRSHLCVALTNSVRVYDMVTFSLIDTIETCENVNGVISVATNKQATVLACPSTVQGRVIIRTYSTANIKESKEIEIEAHADYIQLLSLSQDGRLLVSASEKGTKIRVFDTETGEHLFELFRGKYQAKVNCMTFDPTNQLVAVSSDRNTVHIFRLPEHKYKNKESMQTPANVETMTDNSKIMSQNQSEDESKTPTSDTVEKSESSDTSTTAIVATSSTDTYQSSLARSSVNYLLSFISTPQDKSEIKEKKSDIQSFAKYYLAGNISVTLSFYPQDALTIFGENGIMWRVNTDFQGKKYLDTPDGDDAYANIECQNNKMSTPT